MLGKQRGDRALFSISERLPALVAPTSVTNSWEAEGSKPKNTVPRNLARLASVYFLILGLAFARSARFRSGRARGSELRPSSGY